MTIFRWKFSADFRLVQEYTELRRHSPVAQYDVVFSRSLVYISAIFTKVSQDK
jgi:hypothetical protein